MGLFSKIFGSQDLESQKIAKFQKLERKLAGDSKMINFSKATWLTSRGNYYGQQNRLDQAIADFKEAITLNPNYTPAYISLGIAYRAKGMFEEAINTLEKAPKESEMLYDDRTIDDDPQIRIFLEMDPKSPRKWTKIIDFRFNIYLNLGLVYMDMGNKEMAIEYLEKSLKVNDDMTHDSRVIKKQKILEMVKGRFKEEDIKKLKIGTTREHKEMIEDIKKLVEELKK